MIWMFVGGKLLEAYGQKKAAKAQAEDMRRQAALEAERTQAEVNNLYRQAEVDKINAGLAERDADAAALSGMIDEMTLRRNNKSFLAAQRAVAVQNGIAGFTAEALEEQTEIEMEQDAMKLRYAGLIKAQQLQQESLNLKRSAQFLEEDAATVSRLGAQSVANMQKSASNIKSAGNISAATTLLNAGYNYYQMKK